MKNILRENMRRFGTKNLLTEDEGLGLQFPKQDDIYKINTDKGVFQFRLDSQRGRPGFDGDGQPVESAWNITVVESNNPSIQPDMSGQCQIFVVENGSALYFEVFNLIKGRIFDGDLGGKKGNITKVN